MNAFKSLAVASYLLDGCKKAGDPFVTPMQLIKMVYIAHGYMLGARGAALIDEPVEAWQYGPVIPSVYRALKGFGSSAVSYVPGANAFPFTEDERKVLDFVSARYAKYNAVTLSAATHKPGTPWFTTWTTFGKNSVISNDVIQNFYSNLLRQPTHSSL